MTFDLAIVGGGPAGCSAAIMAARCGARVLLLERTCFPRHKVCGEFVSGESLGLLEKLLGDGFQNLLFDAPRISDSRIFLDGSVLHASVQPSAASIARFDLDSALWQSCLTSGVTAKERSVCVRSRGKGPFNKN